MPTMTPSLRDFVARVKARHPSICPGLEDDYEWWDEGIELMDKGDYAKAEEQFQQLLLSQPKHSDGYEGLALVYEKTGKAREALMLIDHAIEIAKGFVKEGEMPERFLDEMKHSRDRIRRKSGYLLGGGPAAGWSLFASPRIQSLIC